MSRKLKPHLQYLRYVLRHKWFVFVAGRKTGAPLWRLIIHDWTKFTPAEWPAYVQKFYGQYKDSTRDWYPHDPSCRYCLEMGKVDAAFNKAWEHHYQHNAHHWEFWMIGFGYGSDNVTARPEILTRAKAVPPDVADAVFPLMVPYPYVREMVADWAGAGRGITGKWEVRKWYEENKQKIKLHPATRWEVEELLAKHF